MITTAFNTVRVAGRTLDELIGLCRGVIADGEISTTEGEFVLRWMQANRHLAGEWPADVLFKRLSAMLVDHKLDREEQNELLNLVGGLIGGAVELPGGSVSGSSTLPLDVPPPPIKFAGVGFVVTGRFVFGTRRVVEAAIAERGGQVQGNVQRATKFLVVGAVGSRDWLHSTHGRKILAARELRENRSPIAIVGEEH